jgi:thioesterase domain-containing protein/acyl carrier protein
MIEHRSIVRLVMGQRYARFGPDRVFLQLAPVDFDASTFEIWGPLLHGGSLVIVSERPLDIAVVGDQIASHGVTTLWLTAGLFNEIVEAHADALAGVSEILTGGEALSPRHVRMAYDRLRPPTQIINGYGPTECTTFACCHAIPRDNPAPTGTVPIGRPIANTTAYVLDDHRRPVPIGVPGELYLGGDGLARGYLNRPDLTAERFIENPFRTRERLYRTGDLARWRSEGELEFLGRLDHQVKIRGFRIEIGEIEATLANVPAVRQSVVVAREFGPGDTRLIAYVIADTLDLDAIRTELARTLPEYMVPSAFVRLDAFPLTPNGKVDRKALPVPELGRDAGTTYAPPRNPLEEVMAAIWQDLLGVERIGIHDDFFRLGGHSLLALRLLARVKDVFGFAPPPSALLHAPTVSQLAAAVQQRDESPSPVLVRLSSGKRTPPFICFPGGYGRDGMLLGHGLALAALSRQIGPAYPFYGVTLGACLDGVAPSELIEIVASRALAEIRATCPHGPYVLGGYSLGGLVALEVARGLQAEGEEIALLALLDAYGPNFPRRRRGSERFRMHLAKMRGLPVVGKARYLAEKLGPKPLRHRGRENVVPNGAAGSVEVLTFVTDSYLNRLPRYAGRINLFRATDVPSDEGHAYDDPTCGWGAIADGGVQVWDVPGNHLTMLDPPNLSHLADAIRSSVLVACPSLTHA